MTAYDVIIIGGGATGAGILRDCVKRGLKSILIERFDIVAGATGGNHGLLHSGARYAVFDEGSARECIEENLILKRIAPQCVDNTGGMFITLEGEDIGYQAKFIEACNKAGIDTQILDPKEALRLEPSVNPKLIGAVRVPDASVDPFKLTLANVVDAKRFGGEIKTYTEVVGLVVDQDRVTGVRVLDKLQKKETELHANFVVNATGIWAQTIAKLAPVRPITMFAAKGSLLIMGHRLNNMVLNRCRKPGDSDILVPCDTVSVIGTTSIHIPYEQIDHLTTSLEEVDSIVKEGALLAPAIATNRILRAYAGIRPLVAADDDPSGRNISRGIVLIDHEKRDGLKGFATITGGKLTTYRLMAEMATNLICEKLNITKTCTTANDTLAGSVESKEQVKKKLHHISSYQQETIASRYGDLLSHEDLSEIKNKNIVCECENVLVDEMKEVINKFHVENLADLRRRTRMGMGTCQAVMCACRAACVMDEVIDKPTYSPNTDLYKYIDTRWKGMRTVAWGDTLREAEYMTWIYKGVCADLITGQELKDELGTN